MRITVTGGAGFIGSHLCERLLHEGHAITVIDDLNDFYDPALKLRNLEAVRAAGGERFHQCDICDEQAVDEVIGSWRPDAVIHLAGRAGVRPSLVQPLLYEKVNVGGTFTLLEACRKYHVKRFLFASSSSVYGIANHVPFRESDERLMPASPYAATKIAGEKACFTYSHLYGIQAACLRFFTVYGPRQRPDLAIRKFTDLIARGKPIPVYGDGSSARDYTYIDDIVDGVLRALHVNRPFSIYNLGNSSPVRLDQLIALIGEAVGRTPQIRRFPDQPGDVPITYADISKAREELSYNPATAMPAGLERFVRWHFGDGPAFAPAAVAV